MLSVLTLCAAVPFELLHDSSIIAAISESRYFK
jgi:hypothetical protein